MRPVAVFWFRRDLRIEDNVGFAEALKSGHPVLPLFIFDRDILDSLPKEDRRVAFIYEQVQGLARAFEDVGSAFVVRYGRPREVFGKLLSEYPVESVFANADYEPYAIHRDADIRDICAEKDVQFITTKDQVIFEKSEIVKKDRKPYTKFTPYANKWRAEFKEPRTAPSQTLLKALLPSKPHSLPTLKQMGFKEMNFEFPGKDVEIARIKSYHDTRNFPAVPGTSRLGLHLRFGTVSVRSLVKMARKHNDTFLGELIWREFFMMILYHFPHTVDRAFRPAYDRIKWRNDPREFAAWCEGRTGYPLADAGMRELEATGFMHNRVRMVVGSFLCKHLLIDWRWGERHFAERLLDYEQASNVGNWQWVAGCGTDAAPYFRVFNPATQAEKFDRAEDYIKAWVPEFGTSRYPRPVVAHEEARARALATYKAAVRE